MAEINKEDIISDDALKAPLILSENLNKAVTSLDAFLAKAQQYNGVIKEAADSPTKAAKATNELSKEQQELLKIQNQIATALAKDNEAYRQQEEKLKTLKTALKEKSGLTKDEALAITKETASITLLGQALDKNRIAYANLRTEQERNSKQGKELLAVIQQQDKDFKALRLSTGVAKDNVGNYADAVTQLKQELKAAKGEMLSFEQTLGQSSKEYQAAAKRAGEIGDKIADAKDEAKAFQGDTAIENLGTRFGLLGDKVKSLDFKGASTQIKGIAELSKQMTFKEAINGLGGFGQALATLGKALLTNPIFLIGATIAAAVISFNYFKDQAEKLTQSTLDRMDRESKAIQTRYDLEIRLLKATHKETFDKEIEAKEAFIDAQKAKLKVLTEVSDWQYLLATNFLMSEKKYNEERTKKTREVADNIKDAENDIAVLKAEKQQKEIDDTKKATEKIVAEAKERLKKIKALISEEEKPQDEYNTVIFTEERGKKEIDQLEELFNQSKDIINKAFDDELKAKADHDAKMLATDLAYQENRRKLFRKQVQEISDGLAEASKYYNEFSTAILSLTSNQTAQRIQDIDSEINKAKEQAAQEVLLAGGNLEAKARIQAQYDLKIQELEKKRKAELRKQAELDRANEIIKASIQGIQATLKGLVEGGPILAAVYAGLAAIQIAAIIAKPLPQYKEGGTTEEQFVIAGEEGEELYRTPAGIVGLTPDRATVMNLPVGTQIIPHDETMKALALQSLNQIDSVSMDYLLFNKMDAVERTIRDTSRDLVKAVIESRVDLVQQGSTIMRVRRKVDGSRSITRSKAMGL